MVETENWGLGDVAELDRIESELGNASDAVAATAEAVEELERNGGILYPYDPVIAQNIEMITDIGFNKIAVKKYGDHWALDDEDRKRLSVASAQLVTHLVPDFDNLGPVGNFALVSLSLVGPRVALGVMQKAKAAEQTAAQQAQGGSGEQSENQ